jgi:hypothetical protein
VSRYYVGLDVHKASICVAALNAAGKLVSESVVETGAATILGFLQGLRGPVEVTFEEGTHAARLYDTLQRAKVRVVVRDPRRNRPLQDGNKSDRVDARKLAQLLRAGLISPVYHGGHGTRGGGRLRRRLRGRGRGMRFCCSNGLSGRSCLTARRAGNYRWA